MDRNIRIVSRNVKLTDAIRSYIDKKMASLSRFDKYIESISIEINDTKSGSQSFSYIIDILVKGEILRVEESGNDLYGLIDLAHDHLKTQLERYKDKRIERNAKTDLEEEQDESLSDMYNEEITEEGYTQSLGFKAEITKRVKYSDNRPLDPQEAIMQMEAIGNPCFMFKNIESGKYTMIYRDINGYVMVEPENP